jgi:ferritin-like metal-binding protein YciE
MTDTTLQTLLVDELRDIYHAERQLVRALPKLARAASSAELRDALESHLAETEGHVTRLEQAFDMLDETAKTRTCAGMLGIVEEGSDLIKERAKGSALDAGIIAGAQRAEHYEIAAYGSIMAWARALGYGNVAELLSSTLEEEKAADARLSELAEAGINEAAAAYEPNGHGDEGRTVLRNGGRMSVGGNGRVRASAKGRPVASRK